MSTDRFSLGEFSEFLDDSDGHRLAQFLQKKAGTLRPGRPIFHYDGCERISLNVITAPVETTDKSYKTVESTPTVPEVITEATYNCYVEALAASHLSTVSLPDPTPPSVKEEVDSNVDRDRLSQAPAANHVDSRDNLPIIHISPPCSLVPMQLLARRESPQLAPAEASPTHTTISPAAPALSPIPVEPVFRLSPPPRSALSPPFTPAAPQSPVPAAPQSSVPGPSSPVPPAPSSPVPPAPTSPVPPVLSSPSSVPTSPRLLLTLRRSGGVSSADKLRRQTLKRLASLGGGRRTLLKEFESTLCTPDFVPPICSTPMHSQSSGPVTPPRNAASASQYTSAQEAAAENQPMAGGIHNGIPRTTFPPSDERIRQALSEALEVTLKKLINEKRSSAADNNASHCSSRSCSPSLSQEIFEYANKDDKITRSQLPETQELLLEAQKLLKSLHQSQVPKIIIPVNQTINGINSETFVEQRKSKEETDLQNKSNVREKTQKIVPDYTQKENDKSKCNVIDVSKTQKYDQNRRNSTNVDVRHASQHISQRMSQNKSHHAVQEEPQQDKSQHNLQVESQHHTQDVSRQHKSQQTTQNISEHHKSQHTIQNNTQPAATNISQRKLQNKSQSSMQAELHKTTQISSAHTPQSKPQHSTVVENRNSILSKHATFTHSTDNMHPQMEVVSAETSANKERLNELRWSDVGTDDDENNEPLVAQKSGPLNLAAKPKSAAPTQRLRKRAAVRKRANSPLLSTETESESGPPPAHPLNMRSAAVELAKAPKHRRPLNKAPCSPKNGETFALELKAHLARLTNLQILDLRKRNSIGELFPVSGRRRRSSAARNEALKNQLHLEEGIQVEILRRNLEGIDEGLEAAIQIEREKQRNEEIAASSVLLPVPDNFQDNSTVASTRIAQEDILLQITNRSEYRSSLVDEQINDRVSFISPRLRNSQSSQSLVGRRRGWPKHKKETPEVVRKYLKVHENICNNSKINKSKRSLYTKGDSTSEIECSSRCITTNQDKNNDDLLTPIRPLRSTTRSLLPIPPSTPSSLPSPPPQQLRIIEDLCIVSPPLPFVAPPLTTELDEIMAPPDPFLNASAKIAAAPTSTIQSSQLDDDAIFKMPALPAPRGRKRTVSKSKTTRSPSTKDNVERQTEPNQLEDTEAPQGLRRSKRGHVPLRTVWTHSASNGSDLLSDLYSLVTKSRKPISRKTSRFSQSSMASNDNWPPIASSTANSHLAGSSTQKKRPSKLKLSKKEQISTPSYLGDTDVTSDSATSSLNSIPAVRDGRATSSTSVRKVRPLAAIIETPTEESEGEAAPVVKTRQKNTKRTEQRSEAVAVKRKEAKRTERFEAVAVKRKETENLEEVVSDNSQVFEPPEPVLENWSNDELFDQLKQQTEQSVPREQPAPVTAAAPTTSGVVRTKTKQNPKKARTKAKLKTSVSAPVMNSADSICSALNHSRVDVPSAPPVWQLNAMFEQLKNETTNAKDDTTTQQPSSSVKVTRKLRVRLERMPNAEQNDATNDGNFDLLSYLKGVAHIKSADENSKVYMDMRCSTAGNLKFMILGGIDYAFYDTDEKASLGYLRFKPKQKKPEKRARKYHLVNHFVVLAGKFDFGTNHEHGTFTIGDMIAIKIGCRYTIENLLDEIGILMVVKK